jgi:putative intracellular protease/amidase
MKTQLKLQCKHWLFLGIGAVIVIIAVTMTILAPSNQTTSFSPAAPIDPSEHAQTIEGMGKPRHERPVIAIVALNKATEVTDLMIPYGVLARAGVADVKVVAEHATPVPLYPFSKLSQGPELLKVEPQASMRAFDEQYPDGADYVVVPALQPHDDAVVMDWINAQQHKGANIVSVCVGALTLAHAGILDDRRATTHWSYIEDLQKAAPSVKRVQDRRYVSDNGVTTATGISSSLPTMVALVEAIAGRSKAEKVAQDLGISNWDARHRSSDFQLTWEHKKTYLRGWLSFWREETFGVPVDIGVDEIALALTADAYSRTELSKAVTIGNDGVMSKHGLKLYPSTTQTTVDHMLPAPRSDMPARTIDRELEQIATRFGRPTAEIVALTLEYPWNPQASKTNP